MKRWPWEINKSRMVLLVALLFTALGAGVFRTPPILFMAAVLCGAPLVGSLVGRIAARSLRLKRQLPPIGTIGDVVGARLAVTNQGWLPSLLVHMHSEQKPPPRWPFKRRFMEREAVSDALERVGATEYIVPILLPGATVVWEESWKLKRRGLHRLDSAGAGALDPLGLYTYLAARTPPQDILVLPRPLKLNRLAWNGGASEGVRPPLQAARVADAADFHGIRPHQPGEGLRRIHWKSTARTGELHVIEWEEEIASDLTLLLDVQTGVHAGVSGADSLEPLVTVAASIASFLLESGHRFGMMWWESVPGNASEPPRLARFEARNMSGLEPMLRALAQLKLCRDERANLSSLGEQSLRYLPPGQGVMIVTTDLSDLDKTLRTLGAGSGSRRQTLVQSLLFDTASFSQSAAKQKTAARETARGVAASKWRRGTEKANVTRRTVSRSDSLVTVLERGV